MTRTCGQTQFRPEAFFQGRTVAQGILQDRTGRVGRRFVAEMEGRRDGPAHVLEGRYEGTASDVIGKAAGIATPDSLHLDYRMRIPIGKRAWVVRFDDVMHRVNDNNIINRATLRLFGIRIADLTVTMQRVQDA